MQASSHGVVYDPARPRITQEAKHHRLRGDESRMLTGTDEHGLKIQRAAEARGVSPHVHADEVAAMFRSTWPKLGCVADDFIRTTEPRHVRGVSISGDRRGLRPAGLDRAQAVDHVLLLLGGRRERIFARSTPRMR